jgi:hypothetical protein
MNVRKLLRGRIIPYDSLRKELSPQKGILKQSAKDFVFQIISQNFGSNEIFLNLQWSERRASDFQTLSVNS